MCYVDNASFGLRFDSPVYPTHDWQKHYAPADTYKQNVLKPSPEHSEIEIRTDGTIVIRPRGRAVYL